MKILVINEPFTAYFCRTQRWAARTRGRVIRAPDWLAYATAVLEKKYSGRVALYDFPARDWGRAEFCDLIKREQPEWVVLDTTTPSIYSDIGYAKLSKSLSPQAKVIFVGPHASALPEETLQAAQGAADFVAIGEYDYTVCDIIDHYSHPERIDGIAYWVDGQVYRTQPRDLIENLDDLPFPPGIISICWITLMGGSFIPTWTLLAAEVAPTDAHSAFGPRSCMASNTGFAVPGT